MASHLLGKKSWLGGRVTRSIGILAVSFSITGCISTSLKKSVDRTIAIENSCTLIQTALPLHQAKLKETLVETVALRLVGTCMDGGQKCLNPEGEAQLPKDVVAVANVTLRKTAQNIEAMKKAAAIDTEKLKAIKQLYLDEIDGLEGRKGKVIAERDALLRYLEVLRKEVSESKSTCAEREACVSDFLQVLVAKRTGLNDHVKNLQVAIQSLPIDNKDLENLRNRTAGIVGDIKTSGLSKEWITFETDLIVDSEMLSQTATQFNTRVNNGVQAISRLASEDVRLAATELLIDRISTKAADRILTLVDNTLAQLDHTIDKLDHQLLGGATVLTQLYSGDIQKQFDRIYEGLVTTKFNNTTARLVFANAACQRLGLGTDISVPRRDNSIFTPFLYAAMTNISAELLAGSSIGSKWEKLRDDLRANDEQGIPMPLAQKTSFAVAVQTAGETDVANQSTPSLQQKTVLCTAVAKQLEKDVFANGGQVQTEASVICADTAAKFAANGQSISDAASPRIAQISIDKSNEDKHAALSNEFAAANAWSVAMHKVLAAIPKPPVAQDFPCSRLTARVAGVRCEEAQGRLILDFDASFANGENNDRTLEIALAALADHLNAQSGRYQLSVKGYASRLRFRCVGNASLSAVPCADTRNRQLAFERAAWAKSILQGRLTPVRQFSVDIDGFDNPLSFDTPADRKIRVFIAPVSVEASAMVPALRE